jgi:predicted AAA+ superfamily ATPase
MLTIDFEKQGRLKRIFDGDLLPKRLVELVELETGTNIVPGETLLFLDEIQLCPRALMALRYFWEELPELHVIAAGSLLEFEMTKISFPAGRVEFMYMYPLRFDEYLKNLGHGRLDEKRPSLFSDEPVEEPIHRRLLEKLAEYFVVGGMPEAVNVFAETQSFREVRQIHDSLINSLIQDMLKYEKKLVNDMVLELLETIPLNIGSAIKYSQLSKGASHYKVKQVLAALEKSLLVTPARSSSASGLPLGGDVNKSVLKLYLLDIGLMQFLRGIPAGDVITAHDLLATYKGSLCEQFVSQELKAAGGSQNHQLFYWSRAAKNSNAEVDFLFVDKGDINPLEIKRGPAGSLKSLHRYLLEHPQTKDALVLNTGNIGRVGKIRFVPLYAKFPTKE